MGIDLIRKMGNKEKEKAATMLLKGMATEEWNFAKMYRQIEHITGKPYNEGILQKMKPRMLELLFCKFEDDE
jgi:hypothetical protein